MKTSDNVTAQKLRGGFYTPPELVRFCLQRAAENAPPGRELRLLEPSVGDGAFLRGLPGTHLHGRVGEAIGLEVLDIEAEKARHSLRSSAIAGKVLAASAIEWALEEVHGEFDLAVGNPPFVRFQFVENRDRRAADRLGDKLGLSFRGVSNLWIPLLLASLSRLRIGGALAFVVPTECFTGCSAQVARDWLLRHVDNLRFDLFPPGSFPGVLQEIAVMSGVRSEGQARAAAPIKITEHPASGPSRSWCNHATEGQSWTRYLLEPRHLDALAEARELPATVELRSVAAFEVSIVTGANEYFTVDQATLDRYGLARWARPLVPRIRHVEGLVYEQRDHKNAVDAGARTWLLDFGSGKEDPERFAGPREYLRRGEEQLLNTRYKCRIRSPWYRVPGIRRGELLLSKRSHTFPRVAVNRAAVFTTDTIYRGRMLDSPRASSPEAVAASFHNSLTLLTAEIESRSFGGGVLELVPSEVGRLSVPLAPGAEGRLAELDRILRSGSADDLIAHTDSCLVRSRVMPRRLLTTLAEARLHMLTRRLERNAVDVNLDNGLDWRNVA